MTMGKGIDRLAKVRTRTLGDIIAGLSGTRLSRDRMAVLAEALAAETKDAKTEKAWGEGVMRVVGALVERAGPFAGWA